MREDIIKDWPRPYGRKPQEDGSALLFGTPEHRACLDCEHARVNGGTSRACIKFPNHFLWFQPATVEIREGYFYTILGESQDTESGLITKEHPGQTMADACPEYELAATGPRAVRSPTTSPTSIWRCCAPSATNYASRRRNRGARRLKPPRPSR